MNVAVVSATPCNRGGTTLTWRYHLPARLPQRGLTVKYKLRFKRSTGSSSTRVVHSANCSDSSPFDAIWYKKDIWLAGYVVVNFTIQFNSILTDHPRVYRKLNFSIPPWITVTNVLQRQDDAAGCCSYISLQAGTGSGGPNGCRCMTAAAVALPHTGTLVVLEFVKSHVLTFCTNLVLVECSGGCGCKCGCWWRRRP